MTKLFLILILALGCSDNYELIDEKTRFNKKSGEIEVLEESGEWINKKKEEKKSDTNPNNKFSENNMTYFLL